MKKAIEVVLFVTGIICGVLCAKESKKRKDEKEEIRKMKAKMAKDLGLIHTYVDNI